MFRFSVLSSSSAGNSVYIESGTRRILLDAGLTARRLTALFQSLGRDPADLDAVFLTHEHADHVRGLGPLVRKHGIPVYTTEGTFKRIRHGAGRLPDFRPLRDGRPVELGDLTVEPYATPHDAEEPVAFVVRNGGVKLGHATDLGIVLPHVRDRLREADVLLLEANHDVNMLNAGPYPWPLKRRILSDVGHLSNEACGDLLASVTHPGLRCVVLMHLSETNNLPALAEMTAREALGSCPADLVLARPNGPTNLIGLV